MRFDLLFDDLEGQLEAELAVEGAQQRSEAERLRAARTGLRDRLASLLGAPGAGIRLRLTDGQRLELSLTTLGRDWLAADLPGGAQCVVPLSAVAAVSLSAAQAVQSRAAGPDEPRGAALSAKIGIGVVLRDLARRRVPVDVHARGESVAVHGTIDRVGADHFDLAVHERGAPRRDSAVRETRLVALAAVTQLRVN
jgi:hypothetical protein